MELWLLAAGAFVLVGITLWIVWPARTADPVGLAESKEVIEKPMTDTVSSDLPPQGDRFEDQYTSATADLSAGGVAAAIEGMQQSPTMPPTAPLPTTPPATPTMPTYTPAPYTPPITSAPYVQAEPASPLMPARSIGLGAGALLALGGGVGGAWLYARWQRERNKPINRLRRGARDMASRLGERLPEVDELPRGAAPMSGAATALLLTGLVASRALRRDTDVGQEVGERATNVLRDSLDEAVDRGRDAMKRGRQQSKELQSRLPDSLPSADDARKPAIMGIGLGGLAVVAGGTYAVWRLLRRGQQPDRSTWYTGGE